MDFSWAGIKEWATGWAANYKPDTTLILDESTGIVYGPGGQYVTTNESIVGDVPDTVLDQSAKAINALNLGNSQGIIGIFVIGFIFLLFFRR